MKIKTNFLRYLIILLLILGLDWFVLLYPTQGLLFFLFLVPFIFFLNLKNLFFLTLLTLPFSVEIIPFNLPFTINFPTEILLGILVVKLILDKSILNKSFIWRSKYNKYFLTFLFFCFLASIYSQTPVSFKIPIRFFFYIFFGSQLVRQVIKTREDLRRVIMTLVIPAFLIAGYGIVRAFYFNFEPDVLIQKLATPFISSQGLFALYLSFILFLILDYAFGKTKKVDLINWSWFAFFGLILITLAIFISRDRSCWLGLFISLVIYFFLKFKTVGFKIDWKKITLALIGIVFLVAFLVTKSGYGIFYIKRLTSLFNPMEEASFRERLNRWTVALRIFKDHPLFGVGPTNYPKIYFDYYQGLPFQSLETEKFTTAHSEYLTILSEVGIFGFLTFILIIINAILFGFKLIKKSSDKFLQVTSLSLTLSLVTMSLHSLTSNLQDNIETAFPFWLFIGLLFTIKNINLKNF